MHSLLFVDDDENLLKINRTFFEQRGCNVQTAANRKEALALVGNHSFDCIVLDIILPGGEDGYSICQELKGRCNTPIIFLTSLTEQDFLYQGFASGGDDYLTKPYDLKELLMRIEARIRQSKQGSLRSAEALVFPPVVIDLARRQVTVDGSGVALTGKEFDILVLLATKPEEVFSTEDIYCSIWKLPDLDATHTVQVHVARMRRKLEQACIDRRFIQTAWGRGYFFKPSGV